MVEGLRPLRRTGGLREGRPAGLQPVAETDDTAPYIPYTITGRSPAPDAALFPFGKQRMRRTLPGAVAALALGLAMPVVCPVHGYGVGAWVFSVLWFLVPGGAGAFLGWVGWTDRHAYPAFYATVVW